MSQCVYFDDIYNTRGCFDDSEALLPRMFKPPLELLLGIAEVCCLYGGLNLMLILNKSAAQYIIHNEYYTNRTIKIPKGIAYFLSITPFAILSTRYGVFR